MRYFEFNDEKSNKFWQVLHSGTELRVTWGKIGTNGQSQIKNFDDEHKARLAKDKLIAEKLKKGYVESVTVVETVNESITTHELKANQSMATKTGHLMNQSEIDLPSTSIKATSSKPVAPNPTSLIEIDNKPLSSPPWLIDTHPINLPKALIEKSFAQRNRPWKNKSLDIHDSWKGICEQFLRISSISVNEKASSAELVEPFKEALQRIQDKNPEGSLASDAVLFCLYHYKKLPANNDDIIAFLVAKYGISSAIDIILMSFNYRFQMDWIEVANKNSATILFVPKSPLTIYNNLHAYDFNDFNTHMHDNQSCHLCVDNRAKQFSALYLRNYLSTVDETTWQRCVNQLINALPSLDITLHPVVAFLIPERKDISERILNNLIAIQKTEGINHIPFRWLLSLLNVIIDPNLVLDQTLYELMTKCFLESININEWLFEKMVATMLADYEVNTNIPLRSIVWILGKISHPVRNNLSYIGLPEAILSLAQRIESKAELKQFNTSVTKWPLAAIPALAQLISERPSVLTFHTHLDSLLIEHHDKISACLPWMPVSAQQIITDKIITMQAKQANITFADLADLPEILVNPPWLNPSKKSAKPSNVLNLAVLPIQPQNHFTDKETKQAYNNIYSWAKINKLTYTNINRLMRHIGFEHSRSAQFPQLYERLFQAIEHHDLDEILQIYEQYGIENVCNIYFPSMRYLPDEIGLAIWNRYSTNYDEGIDYILTKYGIDALPGFLALLGVKTKKFFPYVFKLVSVELVPIITKALTSKGLLRQEAFKWLLKFKEHAIYGLIPLALGPKGKLRDAAEVALHYLAHHKQDELIKQLASHYEDEKVNQAIVNLLSIDLLDSYPQKIPAMATYVKPQNLPRPVLKSNQKVLPDSAMTHLMTLLSFNRLGEIYHGTYQVIDSCTPESLADFAWELFWVWDIAGGPEKESWIFTNLALMNSEKIIYELARLICEWPSTSMSQRAAIGLEILGQIGSDTALMRLNDIASKVKFNGLKTKARKKIEEIAENRDLTIQELEDRLVPSFGLNPDGTVTLDYGPRQFKVKLDEMLKPYISDPSGQRLTRVPHILKSDDQTLAKQASDYFKLLSKDLRSISTSQIKRFELAMCQQRRWTFTDFNTLFIMHPLLRNLVQRLVLGVYLQESLADAETLLRCFRVAEDNSLTTGEDEPFELDETEGIRIGIVHPIEMSADEKELFTVLFSDYQIIQPFEQLHRSCYQLTEEEKELNSLSIWQEKIILPKRIYSLLNRGWESDTSDGVMHGVRKVIADNYMVSIEFTPGLDITYDDDTKQLIKDVVINEAMSHKKGKNGVLFKVLNQIQSSECVADLHRLID